MNYRDLVSALELIRTTCVSQSICAECPFGTKEGECLITKDVPGAWSIVEPKEIIRIMEK